MADYNSSLPIRTESAGDVAVKVSDATLPSQQLKVNANGSVDVNVLNNITLTGEVEIKNDTGNPVPISAASLPLPSGAATSALQTTGNSSLSSIDTKLPSGLTVTTGRLLVDGSGVTQPISAASLPLPSGASTSALQTTGNASLSSIDSKLTIKNGIADYNTSASLAGGGTSNHTYTAVSNFYFTGAEASGSGKMKIEVRVNGTTRFVQFNSTSSPNMSVKAPEPLLITSGQTIQIIRTNRDNQPQDVYSTILGFTP